ncbi:MAG: L-rhamnose mutarotase [Chryseolinea sp.]
MRYCLALDLQDDNTIIAEYEKWHQQVWPEIKTSIVDSGINQMEIYRTGNRLFMMMETLDTFSFERKAIQDVNNPKVVEWEKLMWNYQKALPWAKDGEKWVVMKCIFAL